MNIVNKLNDDKNIQKFIIKLALILFNNSMDAATFIAMLRTG